MNIYVGNLPFNTTEAELREAFEEYGKVSSAHIVIDRETNRSRGFGFIEMDAEAEGQAAIAGLDGADFQGRTLRINEARPREERRPRRAPNRY